MSLFKRGYEEADKVEKQIEERKSNNVFRFWMPKGNSTRIVFLDDNPPIYDEHNLKINGSWKHWYTCKTQFGESCSICEGGSRPYTAAAYTIIDGTEWTDKKGEVHKNERKLFIAKMGTLKKLKAMSKKRGGLKGCVFEVTRTEDDKSPSTGDMYDFEKKLSDAELEQLFGDNAKPYNYDEILAPKDTSDVQEDMDKEAEQAYEDEGDVNF